MGKLPSQFIERLKRIYKPSVYISVRQSFLQKRFTTFRVNTLLVDEFQVINSLKNQGFKLQKASLPSHFFILQNKSLRDLQETEEYKKGQIYVQGLSSGLAPEVLKPCEEEFVLDLCASPGSKTTQMSALMKGKGKIVAVEKIKPRFYKLLHNLKIQKVTNVEPLLYDGCVIFKKFGEEFDKVLVDAPCSAEARFDVSSPRTFKYWSIRKIKESQHKQKRLIIAGFKVLKKGGVLVYSTCTFAPEENEEVVEYLLSKFPQAHVEPVSINLSNVYPALNSWENRKFSSQIKGCVRILPDKFFEGFFIAKIRKE